MVKIIVETITSSYENGSLDDYLIIEEYTYKTDNESELLDVKLISKIKIKSDKEKIADFETSKDDFENRITELEAKIAALEAAK